MITINPCLFFSLKASRKHSADCGAESV